LPISGFSWLEVFGGGVGEFADELAGVEPADVGVAVGEGCVVDAVGAVWGGHVAITGDAGDLGVSSDGDPAAAEGGAAADGEAGTAEADGGLGVAHAVGPAGPVVAGVVEQPQRALVVLVGGGCADLAEQAAHGFTLPERVHPLVVGLAVAGGVAGSGPKDAVGVAVLDEFVGVGDAVGAGGQGRVDFLGAPQRDVGDDAVGAAEQPSTGSAEVYGRCHGGRRFGGVGVRHGECEPSSFCAWQWHSARFWGMAMTVARDDGGRASLATFMSAQAVARMCGRAVVR
jgi:hypothetical protein